MPATPLLTSTVHRSKNVSLVGTGEDITAERKVDLEHTIKTYEAIIRAFDQNK
jgi:hypothetical protein